MNRVRRYGRFALGIVVVVASLASAPRHQYSPHEKAFYADAQTVEFVRPGLNITITGATISSSGQITVNYTLTDPNGLPLDAAGITTPGAISLSYIAAVLPKGQEDYTAYTTRAAAATVSNPALPTTNQPGADSGGVATATATVYQYVFKTTAPSGFDATATHTIGIYGSRSLTAYNLGTNYASTTYNFVPNGSKVTNVHDIIETASCNACHDQLSAHGGSRRGMPMCVLCHTPQNVDPNTGDTMDAKVFFHKIHMGANLPSVVAGGQYIPSVTSHGSPNYSTVVFPAQPEEDPRRCTLCHSQSTGAAQETAYLTNPTRAACGSCHDNVNFATGANHSGGIQNDDTLCANCHIPQGEMDFDASIMGAHVAPTTSSLLSGLNVKITNVSNGSAGSAPTLTFTLLNNAGAAIPLSTPTLTISATMTGPTTDYGAVNFGSDVTTPGYVTESAAKATCTSSGTCMYTFTHAIPAGAGGTFAIGIEARRSETVPQLIDGNTVQTAISYGAANPVAYFSVDGSPVTNRRTVVQETNCNGCHVTLSLHGGLRNNVEYCVFCHNPNNTDVSTRGSSTVAADKALPPQGINLAMMVHKIHYGVNMNGTGRNYTIVGHGGSHNDFTNPNDTASSVKAVLFPAMGPTGSATTANCSMCHVNSTEQANLALTGLLPVTDQQGPINPVQPITSACTGCHVDIQTASHALSNTTSLGEACNVCHGTGGAYAVDQVHAQY